MKAITLHEHGGIDKFIYEEVPDPLPGAQEVVLRIHAAGVNHVDIDVRNGTSGIESLQTLPHIPGVDGTGEVVDIGSEVSMWKVGDRVAPHFILSCGSCANCRGGRENICSSSRILGLTAWGTYAEKVVVGERHLVAIPDAVSYIDAAAAMNPFATAWEALIITAQLRPGETILVNGAGGGVGSHAVQVAALAGARVIAAVGSAEKARLIKEHGADEVINYEDEALEEGVKRLTNGKGVDVVFECVGGAILQSSIKALADGGRIATIGAHAGENVEIDMIEFFRKHISLLGCGRSTREIYAKVLELMAVGKLKPILHRTFPLVESPEAHAVMESRQFFGRMVLIP